MSRTRAHLVSCVKANIRELYGLDLSEDGDELRPEDIAKKVAYLLDRDRFMCDPKFYEVF
jgi:hypothetical protein